MVTINGKAEDVSGITLADYLARAGYNPERVVVERNLSIIPRDCLGEVWIEEGDTIEILNFVGGG